MKKILIVSSSLSMGGLEKCLIDFTNAIDYTKYEVDLYLFNDGRDLLPQLNQKVKRLPDSPYYSAVFNFPITKSLKFLFKNKQYSLCFYRLLRFFKARLHINKFSNFDWKMMKKTMLKIDKHYDAAVGFEEETACYYVAQCVEAEVKSGWVHNDIKAIKSNKELDKMAFKKLDHICTVSENSLNSLKELYPEFNEKFKPFFMPSLFNYEKIDKLSCEESGFDKKYINIVSVGRLVELKGFHLCIRPLRRLLDEGFMIRWYILGEGPQRDELEKMIEENELAGAFFLLGNQQNPYKYIKDADICVQPSSYEGLGLVISEEKYLKKAVIASNISSHSQMIKDEENGLLIDRNEDAIYNAVKKLSQDENFRMKLANEQICGFVKRDITIEKIEETLNGH